MWPDEKHAIHIVRLDLEPLSGLNSALLYAPLKRLQNGYEVECGEVVVVLGLFGVARP